MKSLVVSALLLFALVSHTTRVAAQDSSIENNGDGSINRTSIRQTIQNQYDQWNQFFAENNLFLFINTGNNTTSGNTGNSSTNTGDVNTGIGITNQGGSNSGGATPVVPEFGPITGLIAALGVGGSYWVARLKRL